MNYCLRILLFLSLFTGIKTSVAQHITPSEAMLRVRQFFDCSEDNQLRARRRISGSNTSLRDTLGSLYLFDTPDGCVIATSDASLPPVLGYTDGSNYSTASAVPEFRMMLHQLGQTLQPCMRIYRPANVPETVLPLCTDLWHQEPPYNALCPVVNGDTCVVGCVATAMAQVMNYHQWPERGNGIIDYIDSLGCGQRLHADLSTHTYQWDLMLDDYNTQPYTQQQLAAVAQLSYDCGLAVGMKYNPIASGARVVQQPMAMVNNFSYDTSLQLLFRNFYTQVEWDSIMFNELAAQRPMLVGGWATGLAHAFVCDGYDANGFFHICIGNPEGDANGYYYFTWMTPDQPLWHDVNSPEGGFNFLQSLCVGIQPLLPGQTPTQLRHNYCFSTIDIAADNSIVVNCLANMGWHTHDGITGIAAKPMSAPKTTAMGSTSLLYQYDRVFELEEFDDTCYTDTISLDFSALAEGTYRIVPVFQQGDCYEEARTQVGTPNYLVCTITKGQAQLLAPSSAKTVLRVSHADFPKVMERMQRPVFQFDYTNEGEEYSGRFYVYLFTEEAPSKLHLLCQQGLSIAAGETQTIKFKNTPVTIPVGKYHLGIAHDIDLFTDSLVVDYINILKTIEVLPYGTLTPVEAPHTTVSTAQRPISTDGRKLPVPTFGIIIEDGKKILYK